MNLRNPTVQPLKQNKCWILATSIIIIIILKKLTVGFLWKGGIVV